MQEDITLKIKADTVEAKKDIDKLNNEKIEIQAELKKPEKNFFKEIEQEANTLGKKVADIKLKKENFSKEQIIELKKEIEAAALKAKAVYFAEGNKSAEELSNRLKEMHRALAQTKREAKETQDIFSKIDYIAGNLWATAITKGVGALKSLVVEGTKFNAQLEYADKKIQSISDKSSIEIESNIGKISLETGTSPLELREGLYEVISAIGDVPEAYRVLNTANKLAITGFTDINNAVDGLTTVLNAYKLELTEVDRIANIFVKTQKLGKITVDELSRNLSRSVPLAKQLGIGIEDITTAMATLTSVGVKAPEAETKLASFFRNLFDESSELYKAFKNQTGLSAKDYLSNGGEFIGLFEEIGKFEKSFGSMSMDSEAKTLIAIMSELTEKFRTFRNEISNNENAVDKSMANMMNSQKAAMDRAKVYWDNLGKTIGSVTGQIVAYIGDVVTGYDRLGESKKIQENNLAAKLEDTANILEKLKNGTDLTADEQEKLNTNMMYFTSFATDVSSAYATITDKAEKYKKTLEEINKVQIQIKEKQQQDELQQRKNDVINTKKDLEDTENKLNNFFKKRVDWGAGTFYKNISYQQAVEEGMVKNLSYDDKKRLEKLLKKKGTNKEAYDNAVNNLNEFYTNKSKSDGTYKPIVVKGESTGETKQPVLTPKTPEEIKTETERKYKEEQLRIETEYNRARLEATKDFNDKMAELKGQGTEEEIKAIEEAYKSKIKEAEFNREYKTIGNKIDNTYYENDSDKRLNNNFLQSQLDYLVANNKMELNNLEREKAEEERVKTEQELKDSLDKVSSNLRNLSSLFKTIGDNTESKSIKNLANISSLGSTIFDTIKNSKQGENLLNSIFGKGAEKMLGLENLTMGAGIGSALSGVLGGGTEGNIGSLAGSAIGTVVGGPVGSVVGGALGSAVGSVFGSKSKKKKKREERRRKAALERLKKGQISGQYAWQLIAQDWAEELEESGLGSKIDILDKVSGNTNYDNILSTLEGAKRGQDGVSMTTLKQLMPQYKEQEIMDWFKSITGGAVLNGDTLSTGEGKYGAIDISALAQQITNTNRELEQQLKETIKNIIDFTADELAGVIKEGFFNGIDDIGDNIEQMLANSLKNAFINTEISKSLFNGLSDKVQEYITEMFKEDGNLGIDFQVGNLKELTFQQYIEAIKKYMELSNDKMEELFKDLGFNLDNLTNSMDTLNKNMSKNVVSGIATNLWKQNLGIKEPVKVDTNITIDIPVNLSGKEMDRYIIKVVNDSIKRSRRSGNGIGRG